MVLKLYVWGPAFDLPSIDAECIAAIAYLSQTTSRADYQLVQSSPSAVPTHHLPALYDPSTRTWASGYTSILRHLSLHPPPSFRDDGEDAASASASRSSRSSTTANINFLLDSCPPLIALSLYVSSANWSAATRPAYSRILPLPLPWTEPLAVRRAMACRAEHLGMSSLDTDAEAERREAAEKAGNAAGWISVPPALKNTTTEAMAPEFARRIKLEKLAGDVLDVVKDMQPLLRAGPEEKEEDDQKEVRNNDTGLRCLAYAYLSLMMVEEVPRKWLAETVKGKEEYRGLVEFVERFGRKNALGKGIAAELEWTKDQVGESALGVSKRFLHGVVCEIPLLGGEWRRMTARRRRRKMLEHKAVKVNKEEETEGVDDALLAAGVGATLLVLGAGVFFYRRLPPFGAATQVWRVPVVTFGSLGAAGAMLSSVFAPAGPVY